MTRGSAVLVGVGLAALGILGYLGARAISSFTVGYLERAGGRRIRVVSLKADPAASGFTLRA